jgi:hypothetical protein
MPDQQTSEQMAMFEEAIGHLCDGTEATVLSHVLTGQGSRAWHFYARSVQEFSSVFHLAMRDRPVVPIRIGQQNDPGWENHEEMLSYATASE